MKPAPLLSDLVAYQNRLAELDLGSVLARWNQDLARVMHTATGDPRVRFKKNNSRADSAMAVLQDSMQGFHTAIDQLRHSVSDLIVAQQQQYLESSQRLWDTDMRGETTDYILSRTLNTNDADRDRIKARILAYCDWRVPGLVVRPGRESWIDHLVALDPLYLVDQRLDLLAPALDRFPVEYRRRMRPYAVDDRSEDRIFWQLPSEQFGYIFAYNFLNFRPMNLITRYLQEWFDLLRPGGTVFFTFNDCDWSHNVALAERNFMCYTPGQWVRESAQASGYEILDHYHGAADCAWMELRRPGKMRSRRGAQTLAKIIPRSK